ncbi:MAG: hypothetical protein EOP33_07750, partial [Rickettsiaceae bacterium]
MNPDAVPFTPMQFSTSTSSSIDSKNSSSTSLNMYVANVRGLRTKSHSLYAESSTHVTDIYAFSETNLSQDLTSSEYFDRNYNVFRRDRHDGTLSTSAGGGVLIAVNTRFICDIVPLTIEPNIECICVKIVLNSGVNVYIYNAYIPPSSNAGVYDSHADAIRQVHELSTESDIILVVGDFNIPTIEWEHDDDDESNIMLPNFTHPENQHHTSEFIYDVNSFGLYQINNVWREKDENDDRYKNILRHNMLDLVFTNDPENVIVTKGARFVNDEKCHPPVLLSFEWNFKLGESVTSSVYDFKRGDYESMNRLLFNSGITQKLNNFMLSLETKVDLLMSTLHNAINQCVPKVKRRELPNCPWSTPTLRNLKNIQAKAWRWFKKSDDKRWYNSAKTDFDTLNLRLYGEYMERMASYARDDSKSFWQHVNKRRKVNASPKLLHYHHTSSANEQIQAELFAEFFATNFNSPSTISVLVDGSTTSCGEPSNHVLFELSNNFILDELLNIDTSKGIGPDGIHPLVLKNCASSLSDPLSIIFNESLRLGRFPNQWKSYSVRPIFKKGARSDVENYRCIAKLPTVAKFFERIITLKLKNIIGHHIIPQQHGFMENRSTATSLMEFIHFVKKNKGQVDVLYTDFRKAFDKVNHRILLEKLRKLGLPPNLVDWIKSYLGDRRQFVDYNGRHSSEFVVNSGVPQGSHLGPLLFLVFINDIVENMGDGVFISLYADDLKIAVAINSPDDSSKLQSAINQLEKWCNENELHLNLDKCAVLSISNKHEANIIKADYKYGGLSFKRVTEQKDLGVIIDSKMNFIAHKSSVISRAKSKLGFVKRFCYNLNNIQTLKSLYSALVESILNNCSVVWLPNGQTWIDRIESVQKQFSMFAFREYPSVANNFKISTYSSRLEKLNLDSLHKRRTESALVFLYNMINNNVHCPRLKDEIMVNENPHSLRQSSVEM